METTLLHRGEDMGQMQGHRACKDSPMDMQDDSVKCNREREESMIESKELGWQGQPLGQARQ